MLRVVKGRQMFKKWNPREKSMIIVVAALVVILIVKSFFFDEVRGLSGDKSLVYDFTKYSVAQKFDGPLQKYRIITYRVFDIYVADPKTTSILRFYDQEAGKDVEYEIEGRYNARVRAYLLGVIPFDTFSVQSLKPGEDTSQVPKV